MSEKIGNSERKQAQTEKQDSSDRVSKRLDLGLRKRWKKHSSLLLDGSLVAIVALILVFLVAVGLTVTSGVEAAALAGSAATVLLAFITYLNVRETRRMRKAQEDPEISVYIRPRDEWINWIDMIVENVGLGAARNLRFQVVPDFEFSKGELLSEVGLFKKGLKFLGPNQKVQFYFTSLTEDYEIKMARPFVVKVAFENRYGEESVRDFPIEFSYMLGLNQLGKPPIYEMTSSLSEIKSSLAGMNTSLAAIKEEISGRREMG